MRLIRQCFLAITLQNPKKRKESPALSRSFVLHLLRVWGSLRTTLCLVPSPLQLSLALVFIACKETPASPDDHTVTLTIEGVTCTEAWLRVRFANAGGHFSLLRDGIAIQTIFVVAPETLMVDEGLEPGRSYIYQGRRMGGGFSRPVEESERISVRTLDTTSHQFSFDSVLLGDGGSSVLYDVAIINDMLVYAVGAVYLRDSLGKLDPNPYNIVKWNGSAWLLMRIPFVGACSAVTYPPIKAICALSQENILLTNGGSVVTYDGTNASMDCRMNSMLVGAINKICAVGPGDIYAAGNSGTIVHYSNESWQKLESGTATDLRDITGEIGGQFVWTCGYSNDLSQSALLEYNGQSWSTVWTREGASTAPYGDLVSSVTVIGRSLYLTSNSGVFRQSATASFADAQCVLSLPSFPYRIRGSSANNVFVVGDYTRIWHYNGLTWKLLNSGESTRPLYGLAVAGNFAVAVGADYSTIPARAVIYTGRR